MPNVEKIIKGADAVLNCLPIVSTVNSAAQALYRSAHKVDLFNPVAPGLKRKLHIHILSRDTVDLIISAIPLVGNLYSLGKLIAAALCGFDDDLITSTL